MNKLLKTQSAPRIIAGGFALVIFIGSLLLMLPCSIQPGTHLDYIDALYTSASAVCVTGLTVVDAGDTFTALGQFFLAALIQIGGLGVTSISVGVILAMEDDFNTADAISAIFEMVKAANIHVTETSTAAFRDQILSEIVRLCDVLGIKTEKKEELLDDEIQALIDERQAARKSKNFARADEIRDELLAKGIILKDTREGVKWSRA